MMPPAMPGGFTTVSRLGSTHSCFSSTGKASKAARSFLSDEDAIRSAAVVLAVIAPEWLDDTNRKRLIATTLGAGV